MKHIDLPRSTTPCFGRVCNIACRLYVPLSEVVAGELKGYNRLMRNVLLSLNAVVSIVITVLILIQGRGGGLGGAWGGGGETFHTRRGIDRITLRLTVVLIVLFFILSAVNLFIR